jgi:hypothetical protein
LASASLIVIFQARKGSLGPIDQDNVPGRENNCGKQARPLKPLPVSAEEAHQHGDPRQQAANGETFPQGVINLSIG